MLYEYFFNSYFVVFIVVVLFLIKAIKIVREYERAVVFRLGRLLRAKGPGLIILIPFIDKMVKVQLRTVTLDVPPQDIITKDNVPVKVNAVVYFHVVKPEDAVVKIENYIVEVKDVELPATMQRAMAKQAEAERERRAKVIHAEGEFQASAKLAEAADILSKNSASIQLRFLQTLTEISAEKNSTIVFPVPVNLMKAFLEKGDKK
ncbi:MAG: hypothetical protein B6D62_03430 [Candidatus Cloacimonas sp. 4484_275]|nr:MAG: hypothetical protein B6D62_03430 [Candidatus Cloacimonas sp. 4484_275]